MKLWKKVKKSWKNLSEFEKYFFKSLFIVVIILFILEVSQLNILEPLSNWISQTFSVPVTQ